MTNQSTGRENVNMNVDQAPLPELPRGVRFARDGRELHVDLGQRRRRVFPVVPLRTATTGLVERLIEERPPGVVFARLLTLKAKELLEGSDWGWVDHSGNLHVQTPEALIHVEKATRSTTPQVTAVVPPQGERITRHLLDNYPRLPTWTELADTTRLDKGYTSRILARLAESGLVIRQRGRPIQVPFPQELFETWQATPRRTTEQRWIVDASIKELERALAKAPVHFAMTGVYAAARMTELLEPERVELYVLSTRAARQLIATLRAKETDRGANLVTLVHRDPGVLRIGTHRWAGHVVVSTSQVYRDALTYGRGRERDAATELRRKQLKW